MGKVVYISGDREHVIISRKLPFLKIDKEIVYTVNQDGSRTKDVTNMNIRAYDKFDEIVHDAGVLIVTAISSSIFLGGIAKLINACHKPKDNDW